MFASKGNLSACLERIGYGVAFRSALMGGEEQSQALRQPLLDAVALFEHLQLGYALVGGVAAMYYGRQRFTEDVDFVVVPSHMEVLEANGAIMKEHRFDPSCTYKLYHESGVDVDIWKDEFSAEIIQRAKEAELGGVKVRIAEPHDLIAMKLRAGRLQDDYDISEVIKAHAIEESILQQLVSPQQFDHFQQIRRRS
jgi:predicted nucleotidyltransferase